MKRLEISKNGGTYYGLQSDNNEVIIPPLFTELELIAESLYKFRLGETYGLIDNTGKIIAENKYKYIKGFEEGYALVSENKPEGLLYGFINQQGQEVIPTIYNVVFKLYEGKRILKQSFLWSIFDLKKGKIVPIPFATYIDQFSEGYARFNAGEQDYRERSGVYIRQYSIKNKWGFINEEGKIVIAPIFKYVRRFTEGLAAVEYGSRWGYIDKDGKVVINFKYTSASCFEKGIAEVETKDEILKIDKSDNIIESKDAPIEPYYDEEEDPRKIGEEELRYIRENGGDWIDDVG